MREVKQRRNTATRISSKNQVTIPVDIMRQAGLDQGAVLLVRSEGPGRVVLERLEDVIEKYAEIMRGTWEPDEVERLHAEWR